MTIREENRKLEAILYEYDTLKIKTDRTPEEQKRYEYLKKTYFKPLTRDQLKVYDRYNEEAKGMNPKYYNT